MSVPSNKISLFFKGMAMGAADVVPGVSGGTIAFITGIYEELIGSIRSVNLEALQLLLKFDLKGFWKHINGTFLLVLFAGIGVSVVSLAKLITWLLEFHSELLWSFFFGLIIASALMVGRKIKQWNTGTILFLLVGTAIAFYITIAAPAQTSEAYWFIFLSGAIAICAMILPGISGSFILLLMGKYAFIIGSIKDFKLDVIALFGAGCAVGLLSFSHVLNWMLKKYHDLTVALLTGFMIGSLNKVWPWKKTLESYVDSKGEAHPLVQVNLSPMHYLEQTGIKPQLAFALVLMIGGFIAVWLLERFSKPAES